MGANKMDTVRLRAMPAFFKGTATYATGARRGASR